MQGIFIKVMQLLAYLRRILPIIDDSVADAAAGLAAAEARVAALKAKKKAAKVKLDKTLAQLGDEWEKAHDEEVKADMLLAKLDQIKDNA